MGTDQSTTVDDRNEPRPDLVAARTIHIARSPFPITDASLVRQYRYATHYTSEILHTDHPWPVTVDLPELSRRWTRLLELSG